MAKQKKSDKQDKKRKSGQNLAYKAAQRHEKSHVRRIKKHLKRYGRHDKVSTDALISYATKLGLHQLNSAREFLKVI